MYRPQIEALEDRSLLSSSSMPSVVLNGSTLTITGTQRNDAISLAVNADLSAQLNINGSVTNLDAQAIVDFVTQPNAQIVINALGGNDSVRLFLAPGLNLPGISLAITVNLGSGHDYFLAEANGVTLSGTNLTVRANGGSGNDVLLARAIGLNLFNDGAVATLLLNGDHGNDIIRADTSGMVDFGTTLNYRANGGDGHDFVIGVHRFDMGSTGTVNAAVVGGRGRDNLALWLMRSTMDENLVVNGLLDGGDLASGLMSRDREDMIATDNVFATNFGPNSRGQRFSSLS